MKKIAYTESSLLAFFSLSRRLLCTAAMVSALLMGAEAITFDQEASAATFYDELRDGDISGFFNQPTVLPALNLGTNDISGTSNPLFDLNDIGSFIVPEGFVVNRISLSRYLPLGEPSNTTPFSLFAGPIAILGTEFETGTLSESTIGVNLLTSGSLQAGDYTFRIGSKTTDASRYTLDIDLKAVPEPATIFGAILALGIGSQVRARSRRNQ